MLEGAELMHQKDKAYTLKLICLGMAPPPCLFHILTKQRGLFSLEAIPDDWAHDPAIPSPC